jgi:hypothetical protein
MRWEVAVADAGQQADGTAADGQIELGVAEADVAGLVEGGVVALGEPGQPGERSVVVRLDREGHDPLHQALHAGSGLLPVAC